MSQPLAWKRYTQWCKRADQIPDTGLARFAARYNVATDLSGMQFDSLSAQATQAYTAALRSALAYSAMEALDNAIAQARSLTPIVSAEVARSLRAPTSGRLLDLLDSELADRKLVDRIHSIADGTSDDVTALAAGVRHVVFHGGFTAYGAGAARASLVRALLDSLARSILDAADARFEDYLDRHAMGPWHVDVLAVCPTCGAAVGERHQRGCSSARCAVHGEQYSWCTGSGRHRATVYRGYPDGTVEALKRGWTVTRNGQTHPDLNRVLVELSWNTDLQKFT